MALDTTAHDIYRGTSGITLPTDISNEIWAKAQEASVIMRVSPRITLPGRGLSIPVITGDPTATIVAGMYQEKGLMPTAKMAGLIASAIVSDTVMFKSPTCTQKDMDMAKRMGAILKVHGVEVTYTRTGGEEVSLQERCKIANGVKDLDLFVSLHSNAAATTGWSTARGWEAYVFMLQGNGYKAAEAIEKRVRARGTKMRIPAIKANFLYVIRNTKAPAVLIEHGFHTNTLDVELMESAAWRQDMAKAQAFGILDYLGIQPIETDKKEWTEQELAVEWITEKEIMKGDNGDLMLNKPLTREQFAVMLYRFAKQNGMEG